MRFVAGLAAGGVLGTVLAVVALVVAFPLLRKQARRARRGDHLVPLVTASGTLEPGVVLSYDVIAQRNLPEKMVAPSAIRPDRVSEMLQRTVMRPIRAGEPLHWADLGSAPQPSDVVLAKACWDASAPKPSSTAARSAP